MARRKKTLDEEKSRHTSEQIVGKLREAPEASLASGASIPEVAKELGIGEATFHRWRNRCGRMTANETKRLRESEKENARLKKKMVAEQAVDIDILEEVSRKNFEHKARRRAAVEHARRKFGISERRACRVVARPRSTQRYADRKAGKDRALMERLVPTPEEDPRYGYRRVWALLRHEGRRLNKKRVQQLWREEDLKVWASPGKTDTLKLVTMSPRKGGPSAGTNTALPTAVQAGGCRALPLL